MKIWEEILEELRAGNSLEKIKQKYRSQSQIYLALRIHSEEVEEAHGQMQMKIANLKTELAEVEEELECAEREKIKVSSEVENLKSEMHACKQEVVSREARARALNIEIEQLRALGFTKEVIQEIVKLEARPRRKLLSQVKTVEKFNETKKEFSSIKRRKRALEKEVQELQMEKTGIQKALISESNRLDELKIRTIAYEEAVVAVEDLLEDGYSIDDITSLKTGLAHLQIKGDQERSIHRLVEGLRKQKSLYMLEEKVRKEEGRLAVLKREAADTKQESEVVKEAAIKMIEEERNGALLSINNVAAQAKMRLEETAKKFEAALKRGEDHIREIAESCKEGLGEWSNLQQKIGVLEDYISLGKVMLGIMKSTPFLKEVPPFMIVNLLERLLLWSELNFPELSIRPSKEICRIEYSLNSYSSYKLTALIALVAQGLRETMLQND